MLTNDNAKWNTEYRIEETSVLHNTKPKHWCVYIIVQQIKQSTIIYIHNNERSIHAVAITYRQ